MKIIYQGFDGLDITFQGVFPEEVRAKLKEAKNKAQEDRKEALTYIGKKEIPVLVDSSGIRGYQFVFDTGLDREKWFVADNNKTDSWNIRVSVKSMSLALHGYKKVKRNIRSLLRNVGAIASSQEIFPLERISRFDYCFDFLTDDFIINPKYISAHSNCTRQFIGGGELISRNKDIEYIRIGKMPNRQIVFYDKVKEIIHKNKSHWWDIWNINKEEFNKKIWRIEIRAGKEELNSWDLKRFDDFEQKAGNVLLNIASAIRYVKPNNHDSNKARWKNKEFWNDLIAALENDLFEFTSNAKRENILRGFKYEKRIEYKKLVLNLISPLIAINDQNSGDLDDVLLELNKFITSEFNASPDIFMDKIQDSKDRW